jgi:hypothetical protein
MTREDADSMTALSEVTKAPASTRSGDPEAERKAQARGRRLCGDLNMRIAADGVWFHDGRPIERQGLVRLFASVLERDDDGWYWLVTPVEMGRVAVEDAPFVGVELMADDADADESRLSVRTNLDDVVPLDADHPLRVPVDPATGEPRPYVAVRKGLEARLLRPVFYDLAERAEETGDGRLVVRSHGAAFDLGAGEAA